MPYGRFLYDDNLGCPRHGLGRELGVGELGVLSREIRFNYPTGSCTSLSDEDRDFELHDFGKRLAEGRPTNRGHAVRDSGTHQNSRVARQFNANVVACFAQCGRPNEWEIRSGWIFGAYKIDQEKFLTVGRAGISLGGGAEGASGNGSSAQVTTFV